MSTIDSWSWYIYNEENILFTSASSTWNYNILFYKFYTTHHANRVLLDWFFGTSFRNGFSLLRCLTLQTLPSWRWPDNVCGACGYQAQRNRSEWVAVQWKSRVIPFDPTVSVWHFDVWLLVSNRWYDVTCVVGEFKHLNQFQFNRILAKNCSPTSDTHLAVLQFVW